MNTTMPLKATTSKIGLKPRKPRVVKPKPEPDLLEKCIEWMKANKKNAGGVSSWAILTKAGDWQTKFHQACHYEVQGHWSRNLGFQAFVNFENVRGRPEDAKLFHDFLMSPRCAWRNGRPTHYEPGIGWIWIGDQLKQPGNLIGGFVVASRLFTEYHTSRGPDWAKLVRDGVDPAYAYIAISTGAGHWPLLGLMHYSAEAVKNFVQGTPKTETAPLTGFMPQSTAWGPGSQVQSFYNPTTHKYERLEAGKESYLSQVQKLGVYGSIGWKGKTKEDNTAMMIAEGKRLLA